MILKMVIFINTKREVPIEELNFLRIELKRCTGIELLSRILDRFPKREKRKSVSHQKQNLHQNIKSNNEW